MAADRISTPLPLCTIDKKIYTQSKNVIVLDKKTPYTVRLDGQADGKENSKIFELHAIQNVKAYKWTVCTPELTLDIATIGTDEKRADESSRAIYYLMEGPGEDAFAHWVYESFITLPIFLQLQKVYPGIRILTRNNKRYVKNMLRFFNVDTDLVVRYGQHTAHNLLFVPPLISLNDRALDCSKDALFPFLVNQFVERICMTVYNTCFENPKGILTETQTFFENRSGAANDLLFLPRNTKDNYAANDRVIADQEKRIQTTIDAGGIVLNTYELNNFYHQWTIVAQADEIVLDYGSSFLINTIFVSNKKIRVINSAVMMQSQYTYPGMKYLIDRIHSTNTVTYE